MWAGVPLILGAIIGLFVTVFGYFRFLFVVPAVIILASAGVNRWGVWGRWGIVGVMGVFSVVYLFRPDFQREDWRGAVEELHRQDSSPTVIINPAVRPPFEYYDKGESLIIERPGLAAARPGLNKHSIWYIPYAQAIFDPEDSTREILKIMGFERVYERHFRGVTLEKWENLNLMALSDN